MANTIKVSNNNNDHENKIIKKSPFYKKLNRIKNYLISKILLIFIESRKYLLKLWSSNLWFKYYILIETNITGYVIGKVPNQLILDNLS